MQINTLQKGYENYVLKIASIAILVFINISCITAWGEWGARANAELIAAFGGWRIPLAVLLSWLIWILANRQCKLIAWLYTAVLFLFTGASLNQLQGGGYGHLLGGVADFIVRYVGAQWLYIITILICAAPFKLRRKGARAALKNEQGGLRALYNNFIAPELNNYNFRIEDTDYTEQRNESVDFTEGQNDSVSLTERRTYSAACQPLQSVLDAYSVKASVVDIRNGRTTKQYVIQLEPGTRIRAIENLSSEIAMVLNVPVNTISIYAENGSVILAVNKKEKQVADFSALVSDKAFMNNKNLIPIGETQAGEPLYSSLDTDSPHLLIAGTTRSGKTTFLQALIVALALKNKPGELQFVLVAGSSDGFVPFAALPHLACDILYESDKIEQALSAVIVEMDKRKHIRRVDINASFGKLVVVIDEIDGVIGMSEKGIYGTAAQLLTRLAKESGKYNISLIVGTQEPTGNIIPTGVLKCMSKRICLQVTNAKYSKQIIDVPDGARLSGKGDLLYAHNGALTRCQGYFISQVDIQAIASWYAGRPKASPLKISNTGFNTTFKSQSVVDINSYRQKASGTENPSPHIQNYKKSPPLNVIKEKTRVESGTGTNGTDGTQGLQTRGGYTDMGTGTKEYTQYDILRMYESGLSIREIAVRIGKGRHYVHDRIVKAREELLATV